MPVQFINIIAAKEYRKYIYNDGEFDITVDEEDFHYELDDVLSYRKITGLYTNILLYLRELFNRGRVDEYELHGC